jgi:hypothetical protein
MVAHSRNGPKLFYPLDVLINQTENAFYTEVEEAPHLRTDYVRCGIQQAQESLL